MLAFAQAAAGRIVRCSIEATGRNITAYATQPDANHVVLTLINKEPSCDATFVLERDLSFSFRAGSAIRLSGPSIESKSGITRGGATVSEAGAWKPTQIEDIGRTQGTLKFSLPRASALIVKLHR
jgi:hypothetical protein